MSLRGKDVRQSLKVPVQGVCIVVLSIAVFLIWLGFLTVVTKVLMG